MFNGAHDEWSPLQEVIIGTALGARIPAQDSYFTVMTTKKERCANSFTGALPDKIIEETEEDIAILIAELTRLGITVRRHTYLAGNRYATPDWSSDDFYPYCPRDIMTVIGDRIIESLCVFRSRYFETRHYKSLLINYLREGAKWFSAPKPMLLDQQLLSDADIAQGELLLGELEPTFDAANILRAGRDIFYLNADTGNLLGLWWLQNTLGEEYRVHEIPKSIYSSLHLDTTIALLRPGLVLLNPERVNDNNLPPVLQQWQTIYAPEMVEYRYSNLQPFSSKWLGMNLLMLSESLAVVDAHQLPLIRLLERDGIDVLPLKLRHGRTLGGGFHCISCDVKRKGTLENYF